MRGTAQMTNKMNSIIIPHIEFRDTTIREAIDFSVNRQPKTIRRGRA